MRYLHSNHEKKITVCKNTTFGTIYEVFHAPSLTIKFELKID